MTKRTVPEPRDNWPPPPHPWLDLPGPLPPDANMKDFLIIGGGVAGLSAAARLSELGSVTLLERESALGYHTSGRSAALYEANYGKPSTVALNLASRAYHEAAEVLSPRGLMIIGAPETAGAFARDVAEMKLGDITPAEAVKRIPVLDPASFDRAAYDDEAWDIDTDALMQGYAKTARAKGAEILTGAEVQTIARTPQGWQLGDHSAKVLVNAAGAWADQVAELAGMAPIGLTPLRRSMARVAAPEGQEVAHWPMLFGPGEAWYMKPDAGALLISPADEDPMPPMDAWAEDMVLAEGIAAYEAHVTTPVTRMLSNWAGLRTFAPDRQLVLGPDPADSAFVWCAGQGGYGMQSSPGASQLLADLLAGKPPEVGTDIARALSPGRFAG